MDDDRTKANRRRCAGIVAIRRRGTDGADGAFGLRMIGATLRCRYEARIDVRT